MVKESLVHIKLEYEESIDAKRDILSTEASLLRIAGKIRDYKSYRDKELELKLILYRRIKDLKTNINLLNKVLPKLEIPEIIAKKEREAYKGQHKIKEHLEKTALEPNLGIEEQLAEIQRKLDNLERR